MHIYNISSGNADANLKILIVMCLLGTNQLGRCRLEEDSANIRNSSHTVHKHDSHCEIVSKCRARVAERIEHGEIYDWLEDYIEEVHHILCQEVGNSVDS